MLTDDDIIQAIEEADSIFPEINGYNSYLPITGIKANVTNDKTSFANRVSSASLNEKNVEQTIVDVANLYKSKNVNFIWVIGPNSTPKSLGENLLEQDFKNIMTTDGMYIQTIPDNITINSHIIIKELPKDKIELAAPLMAEGFEMALEDSQNYHNILKRNSEFLRMRTYLAYLKDNPQPIACAYMTYYPNKPFALLSGSATLNEYRGKGVYTAMVIRRLQDALDDGIQSMIITANQLTSSPICKKFGFKKVCELSIYQKNFD